MEVDTPISRTEDKQPSSAPNQEKQPREADERTSTFVNNAAIVWHKYRKEWVGDQIQRSQRMQKDPIISWSMTYEDLLSTCEPFSQPIPLSEMVDFLVDIWQDEGLFD